MELVNRTRLAVDRSVLLDARGAERFIFAAKATFSVGPHGVLRPADEPAAISLVETFRGDPGSTSVRDEAELGFPKVATDCILEGHALTPTGRESKVAVRFSVGQAARSAIVWGRRRWSGWASRSPSEPEPFDRLPLLWEHAFGGSDQSPEAAARRAFEPHNPVGVGLVAEGSRKNLGDVELPRIEDPDDLLASPTGRPALMGFGFIARHWQPRASYAGTYDAAWRRDRMPLLPLDFDPRFHSAAPPPLVSKRLAGGEPVRAQGVTRGGSIAFALPRPEVTVTLTLGRRKERLALAIDTVRFDADLLRLTMLLKADIGVHGQLDDVRETRFEGEVRA